MIKNKKVPPSLLGIAGRAGSGKDLVGKIIQYLCLEKKLKIIEPFEKSPQELLEKYGDWKIKRFAGVLKQITCLLLGCSMEELEDRNFKEKELGEEWWYWSNTALNICPKEYGTFPNKMYRTKKEADKARDLYTLDRHTLSHIVKPTPRILLQQIGTDLFRNQLHNNTWVNATFADYKPIEGNIEKSNTFVDGRLKHGYNKTRIFRIYHNIKQRCFNPNHPRYENYGGKGITICNEWNNSIESFIKWSNENGYQENLTIDRIDNDKEYSPSNCRWVTYSTQAINQGLRKDNTSGYKGVSKDKHNWRASIQINKERKFLGYFGTAEAASEAYEESFLERENLYDLEEKSNLIYPSWCITDVRFPNELEAIKKRNGITIRVERDSFLRTGLVIEKDLHESETALDNAEFDYVIENKGTIPELIEKVREILIKEELL